MARPRLTASGRAASGTAGVLKFANRRMTIMRGTQFSEYGDPDDVGAPLYTHVQAALAETTQTAYDAASQRPQIIRGITCTVPAWVDVVTTDTLMDEATGLYYMIENIQSQPGIGYYPPAKILTLRMRSGVGVQSD